MSKWKSKREDTIAVLSQALEMAKETDREKLIIDFNGGGFRVDFDDEKPKIMTIAEIIDSVDTSDLSLQSKIQLTTKAVRETHKRYKQQQERIEYMASGQGHNHDVRIAKELLDLVIK